MGLTLAEHETVITFSDADKTAHIHTFQSRVITRLKKNPAAVLVDEGVFEGSAWARFRFPSRLVSFRSTVVSYELTGEQKAERRERLRRNTGQSA